MSTASPIPTQSQSKTRLMWTELRGGMAHANQLMWTIVAVSTIGLKLVQTTSAQCPLGAIQPPVAEAGSAFGWSLDADSQRIVVGAYYGQGVEGGTGAVHVFHRQGAVWAIEAELIAPDGAFGDYFGSDVALHQDTILIGAFGVNNAGNSGAAYLFRRVQGVWQFQARIDPPDTMELRQFGYALDIQDDLAVISAFEDDHGSFTGRTFAYRIEQSSLVLEAMLQPPLEPDAVMGWSVSLDQSRVLIGAASVLSKPGVGAAYVFERDPTLGWLQAAKLEPPSPSPTAGFGKSVSIRGEWAVVGAYHDSASGHQSGSVHVYRLMDSTWIHERVLIGGDTVSHDYFGQSVDLGEDLLTVGADGKDVESQANQGKGYVFKWSQGTWAEQQELQGVGLGEGDGLGFAVAAAGNVAVISAASADAPVTDAGLVLAFIMDGDDCNGNGVVDGCDIASQTSADVDANGVPDECQPTTCPWDWAVPPNGAVDVDD